MKHFLFSLLIIIQSFISKADYGGVAFIFEIEVISDKGKTTGYIWIGTNREVDDHLKNQFYVSDTLFTSFIKSNHIEDTLKIFPAVYFIDSLNMNIFFTDKMVKINESKITNIKLKKIIESEFGTGVSNNRLQTKDLIWLKKPYIRIEKYWDYYCSYNVYFFEDVPADKEFLKLSKKYMNENFYSLPQNEIDKWYDLLGKYFEKLGKYKVVVQAYGCGC